VAVETILFLDDQMHESLSGRTMSANSTANGYNMAAVRRLDWKTAWKPSDGSGDEWIQVDGPSQTWLGSTAGDDVYCGILYDARGADQNTVLLVQESSEGSGVWNTGSPRLTFTLDKTAPCCAILKVDLSTGGRTRYRLYQLNSARGGGTKTVRIFGWSMFAVGDYHIVGTTDANATGAGSIRIEANTGLFRALTGQDATNRNGAAVQGFDLPFQPGTKALWETLRDGFFRFGGAGRPFFIQFQGLSNPAQGDAGLVRLDGNRWESSRSFKDELDISIPLVTEAFV
jgi:hypothetical protein